MGGGGAVSDASLKTVCFVYDDEQDCYTDEKVEGLQNCTEANIPEYGTRSSLLLSP